VGLAAQTSDKYAMESVHSEPGQSPRGFSLYQKGGTIRYGVHEARSWSPTLGACGLHITSFELCITEYSRCPAGCLYGTVYTLKGPAVALKLRRRDGLAMERNPRPSERGLRPPLYRKNRTDSERHTERGRG
jgi:hypothetical protein